MIDHNQRHRLDQVLTSRKMASSRSRARDMIARGCVSVNGAIAHKAGALVSGNADIAIDDPASGYVSRAALKLVAALDHAGIDVAGRYALDLGASTGGFTQVLLERGAAHVWAVDVGHGQMVDELTNSERVTALENTNARTLLADQFFPRPNLVVSDMSFVSLILAAEPALRLAAQCASAALLIKPQFEVGRDGIGKGGIVSDPARVEQAIDRVQKWFNSLPGWTVTHLLPSPLSGGDGNVEYLLCGTRKGRSA